MRFLLADDPGAGKTIKPEGGEDTYAIDAQSGTFKAARADDTKTLRRSLNVYRF